MEPVTIAAIIGLLMAVISYFTQKKAGVKSNVTAAVTSAAIGAGTGYLVANTGWGNDLTTWLGATSTNPDGSLATVQVNSAGETVDSGGKVVTATEIPVLGADGKQIIRNGVPLTIPAGSSVDQLGSYTAVPTQSGTGLGALLGSIGPGTAAVLGATGGVVASSALGGFDSKWLWYGGAAVLLFMVMK